jgi:hypothetical protein
VDGGGGLFSDGFQVRPFPFDGVEIGAVGGETFEHVAGVADEGLNGGAFVERRVVHDKNGARRQFWRRVPFDPWAKGVRVDVGLKKSDRQKTASDQGADGVGSSRCAPVAYAGAAASNLGPAKRRAAGHGRSRFRR